MRPLSDSASLRMTRFLLMCTWGMTALMAPVLLGPSLAKAQESEASLETVFADFLHFARMGRFDAADAYAQQLLNHPDLTPQALLEVADQDPRAIETLTTLVKNTTIGDNAARILELIGEGEFQKRQDRNRIRQYIQNLGGPPQAEYNAIQHLRDAGEYAIPWMIQSLSDPAQQALHPRIVRALPQIGQGAVGPLTAALSMSDLNIKRIIIQTLGQLGYLQAAPYLSREMNAEGATVEIREACRSAIDRIAGPRNLAVNADVAGQFFALAEAYYDEETSVRADPRLGIANVWRWDPEAQFLDHVVVPQPIFGPVMAMECSEEALQADPQNSDSLALWIAADIRREARLGMDVESGDPDELGEPDPSRPMHFPRALYFAQTAGAQYGHQVLARALDDGDASVALGAIAALRNIAGPTSLIAYQDGPSPLVRALRFPNALVRYRAALALAEALPQSGFLGADLVIPTLSEAIAGPTGRQGIVVIHPDPDVVARWVDELRRAGTVAIGDTQFYRAMTRARHELHTVSAFAMAADLDSPRVPDAIDELRREFAFVATPVIILATPEKRLLADDIAARRTAVEAVDSATQASTLTEMAADMGKESGFILTDAAEAEALALESSAALRTVAEDGRTIFDVSQAEPALDLTLREGSDEDLRVNCAYVLALVARESAQASLASTALNDGNPPDLRVDVYDALAESARRFGNLLGEDLVTKLVTAATEQPDLVLRTAASKALGSLNVGGRHASQVVRMYDQ